MRGLTKDEARKLVEWKNAVFQTALSNVNIQNALISAAVKFMEENMSQSQIQTYMIAQDYEDILKKDKADCGGFDAMSEAYVAGVPIEDILA